MEGHYSKCLLRSILAGMCIGIGGCVYIVCDVKWVGAILFSIGLFTILTYGMDLYTGKVGYAVDNPPSYVKDLLVIVIGNFIGTFILGMMMPLEGAQVLVAKKLESFALMSVLFKGVLCGILMFIAADTFKTGKGPLATFICVPVFILAGFEHSIADMFYFCSAMEFSLDALAFIVVVIIGNAIGGMLIPFCRKHMYESRPEAARRGQRNSPTSAPALSQRCLTTALAEPSSLFVAQEKKETEEKSFSSRFTRLKYPSLDR
jgi:formate/nitrite transporter FocA (FNT family)